jgi:hypothetical protein
MSISHLSVVALVDSTVLSNNEFAPICRTLGTAQSYLLASYKGHIANTELNEYRDTELEYLEIRLDLPYLRNGPSYLLARYKGHIANTELNEYRDTELEYLEVRPDLPYLRNGPSYILACYKGHIANTELNEYRDTELEYLEVRPGLPYLRNGPSYLLARYKGHMKKCRGPQIERTTTVQCEPKNAETAKDLVKVGMSL